MALEGEWNLAEACVFVVKALLFGRCVMTEIETKKIKLFRIVKEGKNI